MQHAAARCRGNDLPTSTSARALKKKGIAKDLVQPEQVGTLALTA